MVKTRLVERQRAQSEWVEQWSLFRDSERFLFEDWIYPLRLEDLKGKTVLECGCGGGQHTKFMAEQAQQVTAVDLNTTAIAASWNSEFQNVNFIEDDIASMNLDQKYDIVISIGVVHHTDNPDKTVENLVRHVKPGGNLHLWVYAEEGNFLVRYFIVPGRKIFLASLPRKYVAWLSNILTSLMYFPVYTLYLLPMKFLPYYSYFKNFRRLSFRRNVLNVFDKLNAPQVDFINRSRIETWFPEDRFMDIYIDHYCGISWRCSGTLK